MSCKRRALVAAHRSRWVLTFLVLVLALAPRGTRAGDSTMYNVTDLGTLGGSFSQALGINNQGQIVGGSLNATPDPTFPGFTEFRAFIWDNGVLSDLGTLGGPDAGANGINNRGQIAGWSTFTSMHNAGGGLSIDAALWAGRKAIDLGNLGGVGSFGNAINDRGQVAGFAYNSTPDPTNAGYPEERAFLSDRGALLDLGTLGGPDALALGINSRSQITGIASFNLEPGGGHAFLWSQGSMTDLGSIGGCACSTGAAINDLGQVVGDSGTTIPDPSLPGQTEDHPALWYQGVLRDLGLFPGDPDAQAIAINSSGQVVGQSGDQSGSFRAVLWQDGAVIDLNTVIPANAGWQLIAAQGINDRGQIVGRGVSPNGEVHGFLLTPAHSHGRGARALSAPVMEARAQAAVAKLPPSVRALLSSHRSGRGKIGYLP